jgi:hypothetical protein
VPYTRLGRRDDRRYYVRRATWVRRMPTDAERQAEARQSKGCWITRDSSGRITPESITALAALYGVTEEDVRAADPRHRSNKDYYGDEFFDRLEMLPGERPAIDAEAVKQERHERIAATLAMLR